MTPRFALLALVGSLSLGAVATVGCATGDMITFSKDSESAGLKLYQQGQHTEAAGAYRNATRQNPRDYKSYYMLGNCYAQMGQMQQAMSAYRTSLDVQKVTLEGKHDDEQRIRTISALSHAIARADTRDVETNATVARARSSQDPEAYVLLAKIYANRGDADSAIEAYDQAAMMAPDKFYISKDFGLYLEHLGQKDKAQVALRRAYAMNAEDQQVNGALRRLGVVPGPSLKREKDLVSPAVPKGPIPEVDWSRIGLGGGDKSQPGAQQAAPNTPSRTPPAAPTASAPRD